MEQKSVMEKQKWKTVWKLASKEIGGWTATRAEERCPHMGMYGRLDGRIKGERVAECRWETRQSVRGDKNRDTVR